MGTCLTDDEVLDATQGRLGEAVLRRVEEHVGECRDCRVVLAETARAVIEASQDAGPTLASLPRGAVEIRHTPMFPPGAKVSRYTIVRPIGMGGAGIVYEAFDPQLERRVALKMLRPTAESGGATAERLLREAQAMARLAHPNVVSVHDAGTHAGEVFLAMEYVDGMTLSRWLRDAAPSVAEIVRVLGEAGRGLAAAHAANLIHRDFKPENVLIGSDGRVRVTDFGLARSMDVSEPDVAELGGSGDTPSFALRSSLRSLTRADALVGTPAYMAPEQFLGARANARTDQFSFCVALYGALYKQRPFGPRGEERLTLLSLARDVAAGALRPPPEDTTVPAPYWPVLQRGLSHDPAARHPSMDALLVALAEAAWPPAAPRVSRRGPRAVAAILAAGAVAIAAAWALPGRLRGPEPAAVAAEPMRPPIAARAALSITTIPHAAVERARAPAHKADPPVRSARAGSKETAKKAGRARRPPAAQTVASKPAAPPRAVTPPERRYGDGLKNPFEDAKR